MAASREAKEAQAAAAQALREACEAKSAQQACRKPWAQQDRKTGRNHTKTSPKVSGMGWDVWAVVGHVDVPKS